MDFVDIVKVSLESGSGGDGGIYFHREKYIPNGGPAGGDGGDGGSIILIADNNLQTLLDFKYRHIFKAEDGEKGRPKNQYGRKGKDLIVKVPVGTIVKDSVTLKILADLKEEGSKYLIKGGKGGKGNTKFANSINKAPHYSEPGKPGIKKEVILELKSIADVGIVGLPNAGKSSLLSVISACKPKIASYPFTTLSPNLGVVKLDDYSFIVADIPGLIEGAHKGIGLGHKFLRHIERTRLLVHLIDISSDDPIFDYETINYELSMYPGNILSKEKIVVLNKIDLVSEEELSIILNKFNQKNIYPLTISTATKKGIKELIEKIAIILPSIPKIDFQVEIDNNIEEDYKFSDDFEIIKENENTFVIENYKIKKLLELTDVYNEKALNRFMKIITGIGIIEKLKEMDAKLGDTVKVGDFEFEYLPD
ncbi:MAG: GTPase Obg [Candidatus Sericytochromatia bacterium]|nr:MAG: GTPase Obg [Candidatus Sericytochromatia bacterium]